MKLNHETQDVLTNSQKESKFTINASAQAFKILSDGLYEHKIAAIVRELSCNAYDAHVENGNQDEPFKVILPNNLHPYFEIEDYGIGLDDDGVREVYTSYFTSTKTNTNDAIGAFGLGSKTPFSYTTSFTIRARKNGVERLYNAYLGSDDAPCVNMMYEKETAEQSGVKITVPVKEHHFSDFRDEAKFILSFFKTQPIVNDPTFEIAVPGIIDELDAQGLVTRKFAMTGSSLYTGRIYAVMGGVCYKLDEYWIRGAVGNNYLNDIVLGSSWRDHRPTLFVKFEIGELEVAASRETLSLDEDTKSFVVQRIKDNVQNLKKKDEETINAQGHQVKALEYIIDQYNLGSLSYGIFDYKGTSLHDIAHRRLMNGLIEFERFIDSKSYSWNKKKVNRSTVVDVETIALAETINGLYYTEGQKKTSLVKFGRQITPDKGNGIALVFDEPLTEHKQKRIEQLIGREINWYNLQDLKDEEKRNKPVVSTPSQGHDPDYKPPGETVVRAKSAVFKVQGTSSSNYSRASDRIELDTTDTVFYKAEASSNTFHEGVVVYKGYNLSLNALEGIFVDLGLEHVVIVFKNGQNAKKLERNNVPYLNEVIDQYLIDFKEELELAWLHERLSRTVLSTSSNVRELMELTESAVTKDYFEELEEKSFKKPVPGAMRFMDRLSTYMTDLFVDTTGLQERVTEYGRLYETYKDKFLETYPMLSFATNKYYLSSDDKKAVIDYITMVDSQNQTD